MRGSPYSMGCAAEIYKRYFSPEFKDKRYLD